jgi:ATP adenylyltransferase
MARRETGKKKAKKKAKASKPHAKLSQRNVLFRPDRLKYVHKIERPTACVFCAAKEQGCGPDSLLLYRSDEAIVVMNKYPYNSGHLLILPARHCGDLLSLKDSEHFALTMLIKRAVSALTKEYRPAAFNIGPRWNGDTNFFPLIAETKVVVETLEQTFKRLLPYFDGDSQT